MDDLEISWIQETTSLIELGGDDRRSRDEQAVSNRRVRKDVPAIKFGIFFTSDITNPSSRHLRYFTKDISSDSNENDGIWRDPLR